MLAEQLQEFIADDFEHLLIGRELQEDFRAQCPGANVSKQFIGDVNIDVAIEQRFANADQRRVKMFVCKFPLAAEIFENALKFFGEIFKHKIEMPCPLLEPPTLRCAIVASGDVSSQQGLVEWLQGFG
jgi:hypothetical protein